MHACNIYQYSISHNVLGCFAKYYSHQYFVIYIRTYGIQIVNFFIFPGPLIIVKIVQLHGNPQLQL